MEANLVPAPDLDFINWQGQPWALDVSAEPAEFTLVDRLGRGALGVVYSCIYRRQLRAAKTFYPFHDPDMYLGDQWQDELRNLSDVVRKEAEAMRNVESCGAFPNFCGIVFKPIRNIMVPAYLVMDLVPGINLETHVMNCGRMSMHPRSLDNPFWSILFQIAKALAYLHRDALPPELENIPLPHRPFIHRDVKPANIMLNIGEQLVLPNGHRLPGRIRLVDFGTSSQA